jgi:hypothetical protein
VWNYNQTSATWKQATTLANTTDFASAGSGVATCGSPYHVLVGAYGFNSFVGGWGFFTSFTNASTWNTTMALKTPNGTIGASEAGYVVAMSHDCLVLAIGGPNDNSGAGAVWLYRWNATNNSYSILGQKLSGVGGVGWSITVDNHGTYVASGATNDGGGSCFVYTYNSTSGLYYQQQKLVASDESVTALFGSSVALNALGDVLVIGGSGDSAFWVWLRDRTTNVWKQYGSKVVPPNLVGSSFPGTSIAISADGGTIAIGANMDGSGTGAVYIYG